MSRSGWCPPWRHDEDHEKCQDRLDRGLLPRGCACPEHGGHTPSTTTEKAA